LCAYVGKTVDIEQLNTEWKIQKIKQQKIKKNDCMGCESQSTNNLSFVSSYLNILWLVIRSFIAWKVYENFFFYFRLRSEMICSSVQRHSTLTQN
jgi:hypothetical protein